MGWRRSPINRARGLALVITAVTALVVVQAVGAAKGTAKTVSTVNRGNCALNTSWCTEVADSEQVFGHDVYVGHDEPSLLYYSNHPGAGNDNTYFLRLPKDPKQQPKQDGSGTTWNFQLHPAFWFGMAMCDSQSAPEFTNTCTPDSDTNIFNDADPNSPHYIGRHPGTAFMEMQFYPPGWVKWPAGNSCDARKWCAALNIDSLSIDYNRGVNNNTSCLQTAGIEPVNFAYITKNGQSTSPANPTNNDRFNLDSAKDLFMNSGDVLGVHLHDTAAGFRVDIVDASNGQTGSMTASPANGFAQVQFQPNATACSTTPYAFHPMYSTSSENTRVPWSAHSYNTAFSDETGHFEYCATADPNTGACTQSAGTEPIDADDNACFNPSDSSLVAIGGCISGAPTDDDYDGPPYHKTWPGTGSDSKTPQPIMFTSPLINGWRQFDRVAFETDLPRIEDNGTLANPCNRTTGANCTNPPTGAQFYPIFSTTNVGGACAWQEGGAHIPGTTNTFGGTSTAEYGGLLNNVYPGAGFQPVFRYNDFRRVLPNNPCTLFGGGARALSTVQ